jgi:6-phosphogluconolactonase
MDRQRHQNGIGKHAASRIGNGVKVYPLEDGLPPMPSLPGEVVVAQTADEIIDRVAADMVVHAENCVRQFGDFHLALTGEASLEPLYCRLMYDPNFRRLPWRRTHLWLVDECCLPFSDERSNFRQISETIVDHADIPEDQVHWIFAESPTADLDYERQIQETLAWREAGHDRLDYVLLVLGADGHVAGLYPFTETLDEEARLVRFNRCGQASPPDRVTMTFRLINAARFIAVMATGDRTAAAIGRVAEGGATVQELPAVGLRPLDGELRWYLDAGACAAATGG